MGVSRSVHDRAVRTDVSVDLSIIEVSVHMCVDLSMIEASVQMCL